MKSSSNAPAPDPNIGKAALLQAETGKEWLSFARDAFQVSEARQVELDAITKEVTDLQLGIARDQVDWSRADRQRYESTYRPIEDEFVAEARAYGSPERQEAAAAEAKADVAAAAGVARDTARREAASVGISPASGRFAGIDRAGEMSTALATADAANKARVATRDKGLALKADVTNLGRGLPAQSASAASVGLGAGSSAVGLNQGTNAQYLASTDIMGGGYRGQMAGYAGQASTLNQQYGLQLDAWRTQEELKARNAAGIGSAIGGLAGLFFSDKEAKEDKQAIPEGEALDALNEMPVESWRYKPGVADEGEHIGPYAQDFKKSTGRGDGKTIAVQDAIGITMKAVQDLDSKVERLTKAIGLGGAKPARMAA